MARLLLDPLCVISAWEKMGGSAFASDDVHLDDPSTFNLDLSSWEARLKPVTAAPAATPLVSNIFAPFFSATDLGFGFMPGCCTTSPTDMLHPTDSSAQVVPHCPASSGSEGGALEDCADGGARGLLSDSGLFGGDPTQFHEADGAMSLQLSDMEAVMSASPTSSEAGVVPQFLGSPSIHNHALGSTASSQQPAAAPQLTAPPAPTTNPSPAGTIPFGGGLCGSALPHPVPPSFFVPVNGGCDTGVTRKQAAEEAAATDTTACQQPAVAQTAAAVEVDAATPGGQELLRTSSVPVLPHLAQPSKAAQHQASRAAAVSGSATGSAQGQGQSGGVLQHFRTRAECLERYRQKKARRLYTKKIRYQLRKINADKRPRIKGRFVKKEELEEFLAAQRGGGHAGRDEGEEPYLGDGMMDSDED